MIAAGECSRAMRIASAPSAPTPTTPTVSAARFAPARVPFRTHEPGSTRLSGLERHMVGQWVEDPRGNDHELTPTPATREADGVVALAEVRVAGAAARAAHAADVALAYHPLTRLDARHLVADDIDDATPLVTRNDREAHPAGIERSGRDVEVGTAHAGDDAADAYVARPGPGVSTLLEAD